MKHEQSHHEEKRSHVMKNFKIDFNFVKICLVIAAFATILCFFWISDLQVQQMRNQIKKMKTQLEESEERISHLEIMVSRLIEKSINEIVVEDVGKKHQNKETEQRGNENEFKRREEGNLLEKKEKRVEEKIQEEGEKEKREEHNFSFNGKDYICFEKKLKKD